MEEKTRLRKRSVSSMGCCAPDLQSVRTYGNPAKLGGWRTIRVSLRGLALHLNVEVRSGAQEENQREVPGLRNFYSRAVNLKSTWEAHHVILVTNGSWPQVDNTLYSITRTDNYIRIYRVVKL